MKKANNVLKRALACLLVVIMTLTAAPLSGFVGLELPKWSELFATKASAASEGYYTYTVSDGEATITECSTSISGDVVIPDTLGGYPVTEIGSEAFYNCTSLTSITIPSSVWVIVELAFSDCTSLTSITLPNSVTNIGFGAFYNCTSLTSITIPNSVTNIRSSTFYNCTSLTSITIPNSVTSIGSSAFSDCTSLTSITIPSSVTSIGGSAFYNCTSLKSISVNSANSFYTSINGVLFNKSKTELICYPAGNSATSYEIPSSVTSIGGYAFSRCTSLASITIPSGVTSIGGYAFSRCTSLASINVDSDNSKYKSVNGVLFNKEQTDLICYPVGITSTLYEIPSSVMRIGDGAFYYCTSLTSITIPSSVTSIGDSAFENCTGIKCITIPSSVWDIGDWAFSHCTRLTSITIQKGVKSIGHDAFYYCTSLTSITIPNSVTSIGGGAFSWCKSLTSITIPSSVTRIYWGAFSFCDSLKDVYYSGSEDDWKKISIESYNTSLTNATIHYNFYPKLSTEYITGDPKETKVLFDVRNKDSLADYNLINKNKDSANVRVKTAVASAGGKTFSYKGNGISIDYESAAQGITVSSDKFFDYIIPKEVCESFIYRTMANLYQEKIYMTPKRTDGKPYVSSVYAKNSGADEAYINLVDSSDSFSVYKDSLYDIVISAGSAGSAVTYYLSQDTVKSISNNTGWFTAQDLYKTFDSSRAVYAYVVSSGKASEPVELNIEFSDIENNSVIKELKKGSISLGGSSMLSITMPSDWVLVGGKTLSIDYFKKVPLSVEIGDDGKVSIAAGFGKDLFSKDKADKEKNKQKMSMLKNELTQWKEKSEEYKKSKAGYNDMKKIAKKVTGKDQFTFSSKSFSLDVAILGYAEGYFRNGMLTWTEGSVCISGDFTASMDYQGQGWICGISGGASASATGELSRSIPDASMPADFDFTLNVTPKLKLYGGVGIQKVASADIYGKATLPFNWVPTSRYWNIALTGEVGIEGQVFIFKTGEIPILEGTLGPYTKYYGKSKALKYTMPPLYMAEDPDVIHTPTTLQVADRSYCENTSQWLGEKRSVSRKLKASGTAAAGVSITNLQTSVYNNSNAQIITCGDKTLAAWVEDDISRDSYNRLKLVYSLYDASSATWSEPKAVYDDGFLDAAPSLATDGTDIYVAWQKLCKTFSESDRNDMSQVLENGEIYLAKYDEALDSFTDVKRLTDDAVYDYSPTICVLDGVPYVTYATAVNNQSVCESGNNISQHSDNSTKVLLSDLPTVYSLTSAVVGNSVQVAYATDTDADLSTTEDISVFYGVDSFEAFDKAEEAGAMMNIAFADFEGVKTLFVSDGKNIYYGKDNTINKVFENDISIQGQISAVNTATGLSLFWTNETENGNEIYHCTYADDKWSNAIAVTGRGNAFSNLAIGCSNDKIVGIANETLREYDEETDTYTNGSTNLVALTANDFIDLTVKYVIADEQEFITGETAVLNITVENNGNVKAEALTFTVTDGYGTSVSKSVETEILPGCSESFDLDYPVAENFSGGDITVTVTEDNYKDVDEKDNVSVYSADQASLSFDNCQFTEFDNGYSLSVGLTNKNITPTENLVVKAYLNDTDELFDSVSLNALSQYEIASIEFAFEKDKIIFDENGVGIIYLVAQADNAPEYSYSVAVTKTENECGHPLTQEIPEVAATCLEKGRTAGVKCAACSECITGGEEIPALGHTEAIDAAVPATCTETGLTEGKHCSVCNAVLAAQEVVPATGHIEVVDAAVPATCTETGLTEGKHCSVCNAVLAAQEVVPATGHTEVVDAAVAATCTEAGLTEGKHCSVCNEVLAAQQVVPANGHTAGEWIIDKDSDCVNGGTKHQICSVCGETIKTEEIPATGHQYADTEIAPTCTSEGYTTHTCSVCGDTYTDSIVSALGHSFTNYVSNNDATCTQNGTKTAKCDRCDVTDTVTDEGSAKGHTPGAWTIDKASDCTTGGTKHQICFVCGETIKTEDIPATGHKYVDTVTAPTCTAEGYTIHTCSVCGDTYTDTVVKATGHSPAQAVKENIKASSCTAAGSYDSVVYCSVCKAEISRSQKTVANTAHKYIATVIKPTCTTNGYTTHKCSVCGNTYTDTVVKATGHKNKTTTIPATTSADGKIVTTCTICKKTLKTTLIYKASSIKLSGTSYVYNGKAQKPTVTVKNSKGTTLKKGTDYTVTYSSGCKNTGQYVVTVVFKGNYIGSKPLYFTILPSKTTSLTAAQSTTAIKATWKAVTGASGYKVTLYSAKNKAIKTVDTTKTTYTLSKLTAGTVYKIRVTAYKTIDGKKVLSSVYTLLTTATKPGTPTLKVTAGSKKATLSWNKQTGATGYMLYMATSKNGKYTKIAALKGNTRVSYTKTGLTKGKTYYFKVIAYKTVGSTNIYGANSSVKYVKIK